MNHSLSPLMNDSFVTFSGNTEAQLKNIVENAHYRQDLEYLLSVDSGFAIDVDANNKLFIKNYWKSNKNRPHMGTCGQLSAYYGREIYKRFSEKFNIYLVDGHCKNFFSEETQTNHIYLLLESKDGSNLKLLVDPSFKERSVAKWDDVKSDYTVKSKRLFTENSKLHPEDTEIIPGYDNGFYLYRPIGYVKDLAPEFKGISSIKGLSLIHWYVHKGTDGKLKSNILIQDKPEDITVNPYTLSNGEPIHAILNSDSLLKKFLTHTQKMIDKSKKL